MHDKPTGSEQETELQIDTSGMSEGKRQALEIAEAAREQTWQHPSFVGELFLEGRKISHVSPPPPGPGRDTRGHRAVW